MARRTSFTRRSFLASTVAGIGLTTSRSAVKASKALAASRIFGSLDGGRGVASVDWAVPSLPYRILVEVPAADLGSRKRDRLPASLELDFTSPEFSSLGLPGPVDLDSVQVLRHDPITGEVLPAPVWPFGRTPGELASRFLDKSLPWDFPISGAPYGPRRLFPRGAYLMNAKGSGNPGLLVWDHTQDGRSSSHYAVYFNTKKAGTTWTAPRQGFVGDGSPRRDPRTPSLSGTSYNRVAVDDWDEDGLNDLIVGVDNGDCGYLLLFRNEGDKDRPKFGTGEYLRDATGEILATPNLPSALIIDWNSDGIKDLVIGVNGPRVVWYENVGTNANRKLVFRDFIKADGKALVTPNKPCPESPHFINDYSPTIEVVDWDDDGDLDLLVGGYITGYIWYYENVGNGPDGTPTLEFRGSIEADGKPIDTIWGAAPCAVDLNGDGKPDLITGSFGQKMGGGDAPSEFLLYYENIGTRSHPKFTQRKVEYEGEVPKDSSDVLGTPRPFGINELGLTDLVISTYSNIYLARNIGSKTSPKWKVEKQEAVWGTSPLNATQIIDLNGDGYLDLVQSPLDRDDVIPKIRINRGLGPHGVFDPPQPLLPKGQEIYHPTPYGDPWNFVYLHDFDGNGTLDLLWADGPGNAYLHRNHGTNRQPDFDTQGEKLLLADGSPIRVGPPVVPMDQVSDFTVMQGSRAGIVAADFNGHGKTDIAMGDTYGDVYYFENVGNNQKPRFAAGVKLGNLGERAVPLAYDWDHDGRIDILGVAWSGQMAWYRNLGPGASPQFAPGQPLNLPPTVPFGSRMVIADWDGDGDDDFLVMCSYPLFCWLDGTYAKYGYARSRTLRVQAKD